jgi:hypothetical protein
MIEGWRPPLGAIHELERARLERTNLLVVGNGLVPLVLVLLGLDTPGEPVARWRPGDPLVLPALDTKGTLVLEDVDRLAADDQTKLLRWLDRATGNLRIVSTASEPLWPRVEAGTFDGALYYRLNTIYIEVDSPSN